MKALSNWKRIRRTPYQTLAAIFMIAITLFVLSIFLLIAAISSAVISYFESKPQITVFFQETVDKSQIDAISGRLQGTGKVASLIYVSKDEALKIYQEQNKNDPLLLEMVTADILPESIEVSTYSPSQLTEIAEILKSEKGIDEVVFQKDVVDTLISWTSTIRKMGIVFLVFLLAATFFILLTSIGMKIANRKDEIEILKLVGATPWYIRRPFIAEGLAYGVMGAFISWIIASGIVLYAQPYMTSFLQGIPPLALFSISTFSFHIWPPNIYLFLGLFLTLELAGITIGLLGSLLAVSRYMKYYI
ncbi:ABC transporter permease [Candidatus Gottesmanbacteria bacterium]|nr:ABC transporter permease [Candidatus Gottesmanbacteria bacterium]